MPHAIHGLIKSNMITKREVSTLGNLFFDGNHLIVHTVPNKVDASELFSGLTPAQKSARWKLLHKASGIGLLRRKKRTAVSSAVFC
ncbi:hypothetical protein HY993_05175 [Candidatus Micrarchaeota archaeon]|nr:hypothetical protein [Candidatus Micrarchaeota archaeon]